MQSLDNASNLELLSTLTGTKPAQRILDRFGGLNPLARATVEDLGKLEGVGIHRARKVRSALLLAQRLSRESLPEAPLLDTPESIANLVREEHRLYTVEHFQVACLNTRRRLIAMETVGRGLVDSVLVHPREVFAPAIAHRAHAVVLLHNHPSGDPTPSDADIRTTRDMIRAGQLLKIEVLDHVIIGSRSAERTRDYASLRELGLFYG